MFDETDETKLDCTEKLAFNTKEEAEASAVVAEHQRGAKLNAYKCRQCDLWHLSSAV